MIALGLDLASWFRTDRLPATTTKSVQGLYLERSRVFRSQLTILALAGRPCSAL
jgi:hypothetical protein